MKRKKNLLLYILKTNKELLKQQKKLVDKYQLLSEEQEKNTKLNKTTCYLALIFMILRIVLYFYNYFA